MYTNILKSGKNTVLVIFVKATLDVASIVKSLQNVDKRGFFFFCNMHTLFSILCLNYLEKLGGDMWLGIQSKSTLLLAPCDSNVYFKF